jgi:hypothetical protein
MDNSMDRRALIGTVVSVGITAALSGGLFGCSNNADEQDKTTDDVLPDAATSDSTTAANAGTEADAPASLSSLPSAAPDPEDQFGIDLNINMDTIEDYLERPDVAYRDVRMLFDPARYEDIGGDADLTNVITGFRVTPYPYLATLPELPVEGAYSGPTLFTLVFDTDGAIVGATSNYVESQIVLNDLFPKDRAIFLMCGGGGYAAMTKALLVYLGWDASRLYNVGAGWTYAGPYQTELVISGTATDVPTIYATWRADYAFIDFARLHPL